MVKVRRTGEFSQELQSLSVGNLEFNELVEKKILLFRKNPEDTRLNNHRLTRRMKGKWAFSIDDDIRIVYKWIGKTTARFLAIGGHPQIHQKS